MQRVPFPIDQGITHAVQKVLAADMKLLPDKVIFHPRVDRADTRFAIMGTLFLNSPLEKWLGLLRFGEYEKADKDSPHAFILLEQLQGIAELSHAEPHCAEPSCAEPHHTEPSHAEPIRAQPTCALNFPLQTGQLKL